MPGNYFPQVPAEAKRAYLAAVEDEDWERLENLQPPGRITAEFLFHVAEKGNIFLFDSVIANAGFIDAEIYVIGINKLLTNYLPRKDLKQDRFALQHAIKQAVSPALMKRLVNGVHEPMTPYTHSDLLMQAVEKSYLGGVQALLTRDTEIDEALVDQLLMREPAVLKEFLDLNVGTELIKAAIRNNPQSNLLDQRMVDFLKNYNREYKDLVESVRVVDPFDRAFVAEDIEALRRLNRQPEEFYFERAADSGNIALFEYIADWMPDNDNEAQIRILVERLLNRYLERKGTSRALPQDAKALHFAAVFNSSELMLRILNLPQLQVTPNDLSETLLTALEADEPNLQIVTALLNHGTLITQRVVDGGVLSTPEIMDLLFSVGINNELLISAIFRLVGDMTPEMRQLIAGQNNELAQAVARASEALMAANRQRNNLNYQQFLNFLQGRGPPPAGLAFGFGAPAPPREETAEEKAANQVRRQAFFQQEAKNEALRKAANEELIRKHRETKDLEEKGIKKKVAPGRTKIDHYCTNDQTFLGDDLMDSDSPVMIFFHEAEKPAECYLPSELRRTWDSESTKAYTSVYLGIRNGKPAWGMTDDRVFKLPFSGRYLDQASADLIVNKGVKMLSITKKRPEKIKYGALDITVYSAELCDEKP